MNFNGCDVSCGTAYGAVVIGVRVAEGCANSIFFWFVFLRLFTNCVEAFFSGVIFLIYGFCWGGIFPFSGEKRIARM
jgi:hypothetical protein